jgi:hypothetical protein
MWCGGPCVARIHSLAKCSIESLSTVQWAAVLLLRRAYNLEHWTKQTQIIEFFSVINFYWDFIQQFLLSIEYNLYIYKYIYIHTYTYNGYILNICCVVQTPLDTPRAEKNLEKENLIKSRFNGSVLLIGTITIFEHVFTTVRITKTF